MAYCLQKFTFFYTFALEYTKPSTVFMAKTINIKKGLDIHLKGVPSETVSQDSKTVLFAITPDDFPGYTWKTTVKPGDTVKIGSPLLQAKEHSAIKLVAPVAGKLAEIKRGERRKIEYVSVEKSSDQDSEKFEIGDNKDSILNALFESGLFAYLRQRPFDIVPSYNVMPRDIFVTAFDSAPLAPKMLKGETLKYLESGLKCLKKLTEGDVYLSIPDDEEFNSDSAIVYKFKGPHPAGNVGVQIANIKPVNKGEVVWTLNAETCARIGKLIATGKADFTTEVALCGPDMKDPHIVATSAGAKLSTLLNGELIEKDDNIRIISGNVLTGYRSNLENGFLRFPYRQVTAIDEGDTADEFMGWASLNPSKYSVKHSFPAFLKGLSKPFYFDARIKGGHRAMIMSGEYDKVFPFDIYPEYLIKAIIANNIEKMEERGIYEVAPEDFALPEFVDTSKLELQKIVRDGLDYLRKETM